MPRGQPIQCLMDSDRLLPPASLPALAPFRVWLVACWWHQWDGFRPQALTTTSSSCHLPPFPKEKFSSGSGMPANCGMGSSNNALQSLHLAWQPCHVTWKEQCFHGTSADQTLYLIHWNQSPGSLSGWSQGWKGLQNTASSPPWVPRSPELPNTHLTQKEALS
jgi:hypothetical protein